MKVSIVDCDDYNLDKVEKAVKKSLDNIDFDIRKGQKVLIKPNVLGQHTPEESVTTHPSVIEAVIRIFKSKDCKIVIAESSGFYKEGGTNKALELSGMKRLAEKYKIPLVNLETKPIKRLEDKKAVVYKNPQISGYIDEFDLIINMPKLKTHTLMKYTGAVKNLFGCIPGGRKQQLHVVAKTPVKFGHLLVDIYQNIRPQLNIMDAVIGLEGNGPGSAGNPKKTGLIMASKNAPALDIIASEMIGYKPSEIYTNKICVERKLIGKNMEVIGKKRKIPYKKPVNVSKLPAWMSRWVMSQAVMDPYAIKERCIKCGICKEICPVDAIKLVPYPEVDKKKCINCYCCHENCPHDAMGLKGNKVIGFLKKIYEKVFK